MAFSIILFSISNSFILAILILTIIAILLTGTDVIEDSALHQEFSSTIRASLGSLNSIKTTIASSIAIFLAGIGINFIGLENTMIISGMLAFLTAIIYLFKMQNT